MKAARISGERPADGPLAGKTLAMIFERPSTRTRVSFDVAMRELGGETIMLTGAEMQLGRGETHRRHRARAVALCRRDHDPHPRSRAILRSWRATPRVPVINGLTKRSHPCQVMADILTFEEHRGPIRGRKIAWSGDYNNVLSSWIDAAQRFDFAARHRLPEGAAAAARAHRRGARRRRATSIMREDPAAAVAGAAAVISDCWVSMGDEDEGRRHNLLAPYQVNRKLMRRAASDAIFMHCLPAHRGEEVTDEVIDGPQSVVFDEAENRLHAQKGILAWCLGALGRMSEAARDVSDVGRDDIVLPFAVESLEHARAAGAARRRRSTRSSSATPIPPPVAASSARRRRSPCCSARRSRSRAASSCRPRATAPLNMLLVDFDAPSNLRALARFDEEALARAPRPASGDLLGKGYLAFTIEPGGDMSRYQGVVALDGQGLEAGGARLFRALRADPDARAPRGRPERHAGRRRVAGRRPDRAVPARFARAPAQRRSRSRRRAPRARRSTRRPTTTNGSRPRRWRRRPRITN